MFSSENLSTLDQNYITLLNIENSPAMNDGDTFQFVIYNMHLI